MSFRDYYYSELVAMGVEANKEGVPINQLGKHDLQQLLAVERYKVREVESDSEKWL